MDKRKKMFIGIGVFWLVLIVGFIGFKEYTLQTGAEVLLKLRPVDPRDLFRGDYVILSYDISRVDLVNGNDYKNNDKIYVSLKLKENVAEFSGISKMKPGHGLFIKGKISDIRANDAQVTYGIESYFVPEGEGREIERSIRDMYAKVAIDASGQSVIKALVQNGKEISFK